MIFSKATKPEAGSKPMPSIYNLWFLNSIMLQFLIWIASEKEINIFTARALIFYHTMYN